MRLVDNQPHGITYSGPRCDACRKPSVRPTCLECRLKAHRDWTPDDVRIVVAEELTAIATSMLQHK